MLSVTDLERAVCSAAIALRKDQNDNYNYFLKSFAKGEQTNVLLEAVVSLWKKGSTGDAAFLTNFQQMSMMLPPTPFELLRTVMGLPTLVFPVVVAAVHSIHGGFITGRCAIFCTSEIRAMLLAIQFSESYTIGTPLIRVDGYEWDHSIKFDEVVENLRCLAEACVTPYLSPRERTFAVNGSGTINSDSAVCLELLPTVVGALVSLRQSVKRCNDNGSSLSVTGNDSCRDMKCNRKRLPRADIEILDDLFANNWLSAGFLLISSCACDLFPFLKARHRLELKNRLLGASKILQHRHCDDFAGVLRVCLRLFEQSNDPCWVHVLRILYANVPTNELLTVESLLEQIFSQALQISMQIAAIVESAAYDVVSALAGFPVERTTRSEKMSKQTAAKNADNRHIVNASMEATERRIDDQIVTFSTHSELNGVPLPTIADANLLLLLNRSISGERRGGGELALPSQLLDYSATPAPGQLQVARAFFVVVLSCACISARAESTEQPHRLNQLPQTEAGNERAEISSGESEVLGSLGIHSSQLDSVLVANTRRIIRRIYGVDTESDDALVHMSTSSSWLGPSRAAGVISVCFSLACLPLLSTQCVCLARLALRRQFVQLQTNNSNGPSGSTTSAAHLPVDAIFMSPESTSDGSAVGRESTGAEDVEMGKLILAEMVCVTYQIVEACRASLVSVLIQGLVTCGGVDFAASSSAFSDNQRGADHRWQRRPTSMPFGGALLTAKHRLHRNRRGTTAATTASQPVKLWHTVVRSTESVFLSSFKLICVRHGEDITRLHSPIESSLPAVSLLPVRCVEKVLQPLISRDIIGHSPQLLGAMLSLCRKSLLHADVDRKHFAIRALVCMLSAVPEDSQLQIAQALLYAFSLPLTCRRVLFFELISLLDCYTLRLPGSDGHGQSSAAASDPDAPPGVSSASFSPTASTKNVRLASEVLSLLHERVTLRLADFIVKIDPHIVTGKTADYTKLFARYIGGHSSTARSCVSVLSPSKCIEAYRTSRGTGITAIAEDVFLLALLGWEIELHLNPISALQDAASISNMIFPRIQLDIVTFSDSHQSLDMQKEESSMRSAYVVSDKGLMSTSCSVRSKDLPTQLRHFLSNMMDTVGTDRSSLNGRRSRRKGDVTEFLAAVLRFVALGCPLVDNNDISLATSSQSIPNNIPPSSTLNTLPQDFVGISSSNNSSGTPSKSLGGSNIIQTHLACCVLAVSAVIRCLIIAHQVSPQIISTTSSSSTDAISMTSSSNDPTADGVGNSSTAAHPSSIDPNHSFLNSVTCLRGVLDIILEATSGVTSESLLPLVTKLAADDKTTGHETTPLPPLLLSRNVAMSGGTASSFAPCNIVVKDFSTMNQLVSACMAGARASSVIDDGEDAFSQISFPAHSVASSMLHMDSWWAACLPVSAICGQIEDIVRCCSELLTLDDETGNVRVKLLPISVLLGAVGHACHESAVASLHLLSSSRASQYSPRMHPSVICTNLVQLVRSGMSAYTNMLAVEKEDRILEIAEQSSEEDLRRQVLQIKDQRRRDELKKTKIQVLAKRRNNYSSLGASTSRNNRRYEDFSHTEQQSLHHATKASSASDEKRSKRIEPTASSRAAGWYLGSTEEKSGRVSAPTPFNGYEKDAHELDEFHRSGIKMLDSWDCSSSSEEECSSDNECIESFTADDANALKASRTREQDASKDPPNVGMNSSIDGTSHVCDAPPSSAIDRESSRHTVPSLLLAFFSNLPDQIKAHVDQRSDVPDCRADPPKELLEAVEMIISAEDIAASNFPVAVVAAEGQPYDNGVTSTDAVSSMRRDSRAQFQDKSEDDFDEFESSGTDMQSSAGENEGDDDNDSDAGPPRPLRTFTSESLQARIRRRLGRKQLKREKLRRKELEAKQMSTPEPFELLSHTINKVSQARKAAVATAALQTKAAEEKLARILDRLKTASRESTRFSLFSLRFEVLSSTATTIRVLNYFSRKYPNIQTMPDYLGMSERLKLADVVSRDMLRAVERGVTIRTFKAYADILMAIAEGCPHNEFSEANIPMAAASHSVVEILESVLRFLNAPHASLLQCIINVWMIFCGSKNALKKCEEVVMSIGKGIFVEKEKKHHRCSHRKKTRVIDDNDDDADAFEDGVAKLDDAKPQDKQFRSFEGVTIPMVMKNIADITLSEVLKYVDRRVTDLSKASSVQPSPFSYSIPAPPLDAKQQSLVTTSTDTGNTVEIAAYVCRCAFFLFSSTSELAPSSIASTRLREEDAIAKSYLQRLSMRRRIQTIGLAIRVLFRCNRDCARLLKAVTSEIKALSAAESAIKRLKTMQIHRKNADGFSDSDLDALSDDDRAADSELSSCEEQCEDIASRSKLNQSPIIPEILALYNPETAPSKHNEGEEDGTSARCEGSTCDGDAIKLNDDRNKHDAGGMPRDYFFLLGLLTAVSPDAVLNAKGWIHICSSDVQRSSLKAATSSAANREKSCRQHVAGSKRKFSEGFGSVAEDNLDSDDDEVEVEVEDRSARGSAKDLRRETTKGDDLNQSDETKPSTIAAVCSKRANALAMKVTELEWRLASLIKESNRLHALRAKHRRSIACLTDKAVFSFRDVLIDALNVVVKKGQVLLDRLSSCSSDRYKLSDNIRAVGSNKKRLTKLQTGNHADDNAYGEIPIDDEDDSFIPNRSRLSIRSSMDAMAAVGLPRHRRATERQSREGHNLDDRSKGRASTKKYASRLRSRNCVIDEWLGEEDGTDTYADLEDFLVA